MKVLEKLKTVIRGLTHVEYAIMVVAFAAMVIAYFISVVNRNFIKTSLAWTEELALYSMVFMALFGTEIGLRDGTQVSITALTSKLKGKVELVVWVITKVILIAFVCLMTKYGYALMVKQMATGQTSPIMKIPMWFIYSSLVISFGMMAFVQTVLLICRLAGVNTDDITGLKTKKDDEKEIEEKGEKNS